MEAIEKKQDLITGYLELLLKDQLKLSDYDSEIVTPADPVQRGNHLTLQFKNPDFVLEELKKYGSVIGL